MARRETGGRDGTEPGSGAPRALCAVLRAAQHRPSLRRHGSLISHWAGEQVFSAARSGTRAPGGAGRPRSHLPGWRSCADPAICTQLLATCLAAPGEGCQTVTQLKELPTTGTAKSNDPNPSPTSSARCYHAHFTVKETGVKTADVPCLVSGRMGLELTSARFPNPALPTTARLLGM